MKYETHENQRIAELPSAFLVSSHPSSRATGNIVTPVTPSKTMITNRPAVSFGLTFGKEGKEGWC